MGEFYIRNFYCASWLFMHKIKPKRIEMTPKNFRLFFYDEVDETKLLISDFYENKELQQYVKKCTEFKKYMYKLA